MAGRSSLSHHTALISLLDMLSIALLVTAYVAICQSTISPAFQAYIRQNYPANFNQVARLDLGAQGSYGGGNHVPGTKTR